MCSLRLTGGVLRGRRLSGRGGPDRRPTSERVREAIFSILASRDALEGAHVYDLFAGTGALGFEALSRGAASALFVDHDKRALEAIEQDIDQLGLSEFGRVQRADLTRDVELLGRAATLVFLDPPYTQSDLIEPLLGRLIQSEELAPGAWIVVESAQRHSISLPTKLHSDRVYRYGDTRVTLARLQ